MIREIGVELGARLRSQGCPLPVLDGPEVRGTCTWARPRIVLEQPELSDSIGPVLSQHQRPKHAASRQSAFAITIFAQSAKAGAMPFEHRRVAEIAADFVILALHHVVTVRRQTLTFGRCGPFTPPDLVGSESPGGACYRIEGTISRGVFERTWVGALTPTVTIGANTIQSTTSVSLAHVEGDPDDQPPTGAATACGA